VDFPVVESFIMSRGVTSEFWGDALWQEVVLTDGRRLIIWRADDGSTTSEDDDDVPRRHLDASVRTILLSTIADHILTTEFEVLDGGPAGSRRFGCGCTRSC
jgi:hypothetical protein